MEPASDECDINTEKDVYVPSEKRGYKVCI